MGYRVVAPDGTQLYCINATALHFVPEGIDIPTKVHTDSTPPTTVVHDCAGAGSRGGSRQKLM